MFSEKAIQAKLKSRYSNEDTTEEWFCLFLIIRFIEGEFWSLRELSLTLSKNYQLRKKCILLDTMIINFVIIFSKYNKTDLRCSRQKVSPNQLQLGSLSSLWESISGISYTASVCKKRRSKLLLFEQSREVTSVKLWYMLILSEKTTWSSAKWSKMC